MFDVVGDNFDKLARFHTIVANYNILWGIITTVCCVELGCPSGRQGGAVERKSGYTQDKYRQFL